MARDRQTAERVQGHRPQVRRDGGLLARAQGRSSGRSGMDGYSSLVDSWLAADRRMPRKQRHTAKRVYDRLVEEAGFTGSYSMVQRYVKRWREDHRLPDDGFMELEWRPGTMQVDFGQALAVIGGAESTVHCWSPRSRIRTCGTPRPCPGRTRSAYARGCWRSSSTSAWSRR